MATVRELTTKWGFSIDDRPLRQVDARISNLKSSLNGLASLSRNIAFGFTGLAAGIGYLLKQAGDFEQTEVAFEVLTQSTAKAKKLTSDLIDFAQKTPFELKGLFESTKQLLAYGIESENMIKTLTALGNIAAGVGKDKLPQLTLAFGQVRTAGKLRGTEVRQFTEAGVPILEAVAQEMGVATSAVTDLVSKGAVSFATVDAALQKMANGTGRFSGLMEKQSQTMLGLFSNLKDAMQILAVTVGGTLVPEAKAYLKIAIDWLQVNKELIQQNVSAGVRAIVDGMQALVKVGRAVFRIMTAVVNSLGGFENAVKLATFALSAFVGVRVLTFMGNVGLVALSAAKNLGIFVAMSRTAAVTMLTLKFIALAIPLAIGAALAALFLIIEDLVVFFQGGDSLIGDLVNGFDKAAPAFLQVFEDLETKALAKIRSLFDSISNFLTNEEFAGTRSKIGDALLAAMDVAIVGSALLTKIGFNIGQAIFDGVVQAFVDGSPKLASFLGLTSKTSRAADFKKEETRNEVQGAAANIKKFGLSDTAASGAYSPEMLAKARQFLESDAGKTVSQLQARPSGSAIDYADPSGKLGAALADGIIEVTELPQVSEALQKLVSLTGINPRQLIAGADGIPLSQKGKNAEAPIEFKTSVVVNGSNLNPEEMKQAIERGVGDAQLKVVRDITNQATSSIAE